MIDSLGDTLWTQVERILVRHETRVVSQVPGVLHEVRRVPSEFYILAAYASFMMSRKRADLTVSVDAKCRRGMLLIDCEVCLDSGESIAEGPAIATPVVDGEFAMAEVIRWVDEFDAFLKTHEQVIVSRVAAL